MDFPKIREYFATLTSRRNRGKIALAEQSVRFQIVACEPSSRILTGVLASSIGSRTKLVTPAAHVHGKISPISCLFFPVDSRSHTSPKFPPSLFILYFNASTLSDNINRLHYARLINLFLCHCIFIEFLVLCIERGRMKKKENRRGTSLGA